MIIWIIHFISKFIAVSIFFSRMVMDDRKELLARAEIMNRVYQRDITNLDSEIERLERILTKEFHVNVSTLDEVTIINI
jgi:uncharacterized tellurite resistance protein B-like protein